MPEITWDVGKAAANLRKHGVSFDEARTVFDDPLSRTAPDPAHSDVHEERFTTIGHSNQGVTLVVSHVGMNENIRLISARKATLREQFAYEEV